MYHEIEQKIYNRRYDKLYIMLKQEENGYQTGGKPAIGSCTIEIRNGTGKISLHVQNLRKSSWGIYKVYLISCTSQRAQGIPICLLEVDDRGQADVKMEFNPENVGQSKLAIENFQTVAVLEKSLSGADSRFRTPLVGYLENKCNWKSIFVEYRSKQNDCILTAASEQLPPPLPVEPEITGPLVDEEIILEEKEIFDNNMNSKAQQRQLEQLEKEKLEEETAIESPSTNNASSIQSFQEKQTDFENNRQLLRQEQIELLRQQAAEMVDRKQKEMEQANTLYAAIDTQSDYTGRAETNPDYLPKTDNPHDTFRRIARNFKKELQELEKIGVLTPEQISSLKIALPLDRNEGEQSDQRIQKEPAEQPKQMGQQTQEEPADQPKQMGQPTQEEPADQPKQMGQPTQEGAADQPKQVGQPTQEGPADQSRQTRQPVQEGPADQSRQMGQPTQEGPADQSRQTRQPVQEEAADQSRQMGQPVQEGPTEQSRQMGQPVQEELTDQSRQMGQPVQEEPADQSRQTRQPTQEGPTEQSRQMGQPTQEGPADQPKQMGQPTQEGPTEQSRQMGQPTQEEPADQPKQMGQPTQEGPADQSRQTRQPVQEGPADQSRQTGQPTQGGPTDQSRLSGQENNASISSQQTDLEYIFENNDALMPFFHDDDWKWVRIAPEELAVLPGNCLAYRNYPFFACNSRKYGHYLLGKPMNAQRQGYLLGIPDRYYSENKLLADRLGFGSFRALSDQKPTEGCYGYWLKNLSSQ